MKTYTPVPPSKEFDIGEALQFVSSYDPFRMSDTAGMLNYMLQNVIYDGMKTGEITFPQSASTTLGSTEAQFRLPRSTVAAIFQRHLVYGLLSEADKKQIDDMLAGEGDLLFTLPAGGNISNVVVPMPQLEVGSLFGTELLVRFIPPISLGE